jgi:hypothetical protein
MDSSSTSGSPTSLTTISSNSHHNHNSTTNSITTNNPMNSSNGLHSNGLTSQHPVNHNNNSLRLNHNNNNKILTSNDRILNQGIKPLTHHQQETINKLVMFQEEFEAPPDDELRKITVSIFFCELLLFVNGIKISPDVSNSLSSFRRSLFLCISVCICLVSGDESRKKE